MQSIIYDVAVSLDGFIAGPGGDISQFAHEGEVVDDYFARLGGYAVAIMGRETYEFGYRFGLEPGQNPYKHMRTLVFSERLRCPEDMEIEIEPAVSPQRLEDLKASAPGPIYLCGGGRFAATVLNMGLLDRLRIKRSPMVLGAGIRLFEGADRAAHFKRVETKVYESGHLLEEFALPTA